MAHVKKGQKVLFMGPRKTPCYGRVRRVTGNLVAIVSLGPLHPAGMLIDAVAANTVHVVHRDRVLPTA
jgi:hypothetical protein